MGIGLSRLWKKKRIGSMALDEVRFLKSRGTTLYLDVGANIGQTARGLRSAGWDGQIISFEPLPDCFQELHKSAISDSKWSALNMALGDTDSMADMGVSKSRASSSLRKTTELLTSIHEPTTYEATIQVPVKRLDTVLPGIASDRDIIHLKIDTQGYEKNVVEGALGAIGRIDSIRMEVAISEVYEGEMTLPDAILKMKELGFLLVDAWNGWRHPRTNELLQLDLLFRTGAMSA
ncbi:FkbM family methyltransferase [Agrobacterium sp. ES01]|uniref:FkbM family methyltransferase n=1 Tax=Agrobacterium sp. ES01 TaxID=3420714 RepID=UPI003D09C410